MNKKRIIVIVVALILLFFGVRVVQRVRRGGAGAARGPARAIPVSVAPVRRGTVRSTAEFTGSLLARARFDVAPKVPGRLERLFVDLGDIVTNGALVAELDSDEYEQQVEQARAEVEVAKANWADAKTAFDVARREYERIKELRGQQIASAAELDQAEAMLRAAEAKEQVGQAQIRQREAALRGTEIRLDYTRIAATWADGPGPRVVSERYADEGTMLKANDPLVAVADIGSVVAVVFAIERDFTIIRIGQEATIITDAYPGREFKGRVARRAPVLREESRQARIEIEVPNAEGLLAPGMFVRARIQLDAHDEAQIVPVAAVVRRNGNQGVFLADEKEGQARFVSVRTGLVEGDLAEIVEPELRGSVVTLGQHLLEDGFAITVAEARP